MACGCVTSTTQVGQHRSPSGSALLGLDGVEVLAARVGGGEWQLEVQTTVPVVGCVGCGVWAEAHGRRLVRVRDLPIGGRPVVLVWRKRIWRCREPACRVRTWTERVAAIGPRAVLTERAGPRPVGGSARTPTRVWSRSAWTRPTSSRRPVTRPPSGSRGWWTWSAAGCWTWWPTAPGERCRDGRPRSMARVRQCAGHPAWPCHGSGGRKLLLTAQEQLTQRGRLRLRAGLAAGDPTGAVAAPGKAKNSYGPSRSPSTPQRPAPWWSASTAGADGVQARELSRLARTVKAWEVEILAFHSTAGMS
jgi:hypothetical protein